MTMKILCFVFEFFGDAEIGEFGVAIGEEEDVFGFEVAIDDVLLVKVVESEDNSSENEGNSLVGFLLKKNDFLAMKIILISN